MNNKKVEIEKRKLFCWRPKSENDVRGFKFRKLYGFILDKKNILSGYRGSIAHGLTIKPEENILYGIDDKDTFTVYCYPIEYYLSLESYYHRAEVYERKENGDDLVVIRSTVNPGDCDRRLTTNLEKLFIYYQVVTLM